VDGFKADPGGDGVDSFQTLPPLTKVSPFEVMHNS
jgi:hypothetical protein